MGKKTRLTQDQVLQIAQDFNEGIQHVSNLVEGEESQAFLCSTDNNEQFVIRINVSRFGFDKDEIASSDYSNDLPVPNVYRIGDKEGVFYCITQFIPGDTVQGSDEEILSRLVEDIDRVWKKIKPLGNQTMGYGPLDTNSKGSHASWKEYLLALLKDTRWKLLNDRFDQEWIEHIQSTYAKLVQACPDNLHELIHGDFGANNLLTDGNKITGVIDWDSTMCGDGLYDVATSAYWAPWLPCMKIQSDYWKGQLATAPNFSERLLCYQLHIGLQEIMEDLEEGGSDMLDWHTKQINTLIK